MRTSVIPPQIFLPLGAVKLGRLVTSIQHPHQNYHDPLPSHTAAQTPNLISARDSFTSDHTTNSNLHLRSSLTSLLSTGFSKQTKTRTQITTEQVQTYTLANSDAWFDEAMKLPAARAWIERNIDRGRTIYLIVGYHTATDACIRQASVVEGSTTGEIVLPVGMALASAAGVAGPVVSSALGEVLDPSVMMEAMEADGEAQRCVFRGEQVCAVEYRKVRHRWLSSRDLDKARLSERVCRWSSVEQSRDDEGEEEEDVIEVELDSKYQLIPRRYVKINKVSFKAGLKGCQRSLSFMRKKAENQRR
ncbi:hypothetical protein B0T16DRAFT_507676 [Cercophora newfieldiana]|uniref:Uncharacterized protein n=1 Tax=Cercophora newfieldiana TaxID=92897 RepID=A0AA39YB81_9PEZI|nr:hypothetical protein B0T16DRAFT_507676 [Cercophora newfieldiana]